MKAFALRAQNLLFGFTKSKPINLTPWSFEIEEGKLVAVIGPNGTGKTSFLRALMGDSTFLSGAVCTYPEDKSVHLWKSHKIYQTFSYLPQESLFDPLQLTQHQLNLALLPKLGWWGQTEASDKEPLELLSRDLDLAPLLNRTLQELSSGERQKVFLTRSLLQPSKIVLLDEPTNHLDPNLQEVTWRTLRKQTPNRTIILATHDLDRIERHCDSVIAITKREMLFVGSLAEYLEKDIKRQVFPLIG